MKKTSDRPVVVRIPDPLIKKLDAAARRAERSRSVELRLRLEESLSRVGALTTTVTTTIVPAP